MLAGAGASALGATAASAVKLGPASISTRVDSPDWPLVHHDAHNTGFNPHAAGPASDPAVRWQADRFDPAEPFQGYVFLPTPVVAGGRVYVGGRTFSALRAGDGREVWSVDGEADETFHGAAHADDRVFVATWRESANSAGIVALGDSTGERDWHREFDAGQPEPPLVAGDAIYVPTRSAISAFGRESGSSTWRLGDLFPSITRPAVTDDALYVPEDWQGLAARDRRQDAIATVLGDPPEVRWRAEVEEMAGPTPSIGDDGRIFVPETEEWHPHNDEGEGVLAAVDPDGTRRWTKSGGTFGTAPVVGDGTVYYKCGANTRTKDMGAYVESQSDAKIAAHDARDGSVRWRRRFGDLGDWQIPPVLDGEHLYVPLHDGVRGRSGLVALDAESGETVWRQELDSPAFHLALAGDTLYVSTAAGSLLALA